MSGLMPAASGAPTFRDELIPVGEVKIFAQLLGAEDAPPVLFLSGLGYASWCWEEVMQALQPGYRCLALDNRGTGRSDKPEGPYTISMMADDAALALRSLGVSSRWPAHVVGNSMGGYIALTLAARYPALVRSLALVGTSK